MIAAAKQRMRLSCEAAAAAREGSIMSQLGKNGGFFLTATASTSGRPGAGRGRGGGGGVDVWASDSDSEGGEGVGDGAGAWQARWQARIDAAAAGLASAPGRAAGAPGAGAEAQGPPRVPFSELRAGFFAQLDDLAGRVVVAKESHRQAFAEATAPRG